MKLLVVVAVIVLVLWLARSTRPAPPPVRRPAARDADGPQPMVACAQCGVHLPQGDALPGRGGMFCSEAHRAAFEREHAPR